MAFDDRLTPPFDRQTEYNKLAEELKQIQDKLDLNTVEAEKWKRLLERAQAFIKTLEEGGRLTKDQFSVLRAKQIDVEHFQNELDKALANQIVLSKRQAVIEKVQATLELH